MHGINLKNVEEYMSRSLQSGSRQSFIQASKATKECTSSTGVFKLIVDSMTNALKTPPKNKIRTCFSTEKLRDGLMVPETSMIIGQMIEKKLGYNTLKKSKKTMAAPSPGSLKAQKNSESTNYYDQVIILICSLITHFS